MLANRESHISESAPEKQSANDGSKVYLVEICPEGALSHSKTIKKVLWDLRKPISLNHPTTHILEYRDGVFQIRKLGKEQKLYPFPNEAIHQGARFKLLIDREKQKKIIIRIGSLTRNRAAYLPSGAAKAGQQIVAQAQLHVASGVGNTVGDFEKLESRFLGRMDGRPVFVLEKSSGSISLTSQKYHVTFKINDSAPKILLPGVATQFKLHESDSATIQLGGHWWRINSVPVSNFPIGEVSLFDQELSEDTHSLKTIVTSLLIPVVGLFLLAKVHPSWFTSRRESAKQKEVVVQLKKPTLIHKVEKKLPAPVPKPKPEIKKVQELKPVAPAKQKKMPRSAPKQKKMPRPKSRPVPLFQRSHPKMLPMKHIPARSNPVAHPNQRIHAVSNHVQSQRRSEPSSVSQQVELSKSLSFLSSSKPISKNGNLTASQDSNRYQNLNQNIGHGIGRGGGSRLSDMARGSTSNESISTSSARAYDLGSGAYGSTLGHKGLNHVQGKVRGSELSQYGGADFGSSLSSNGLVVGGQGTVSESEILRVLSKYLQKFQYCYEKALLSDSSLTGSVVLQWIIQSSGTVAQARVVQSHIQSQALHQCIIHELNNISFPKPKSGSVTVKYPFNFSSSSL